MPRESKPPQEAHMLTCVSAYTHRPLKGAVITNFRVKTPIKFN